MQETKQDRNLGAVMLAAAGIILFSSKAILVKKAYIYTVDPLSLLLMRMLFVLPVYTFIAIVSSWGKKGKDRLSRKEILFLILLGLGGYYLSSLLDFAGLKHITASLERLILFIYPTLVVLITAFLYRKPIPHKQIWAIAITYFGIFLVFNQEAGLHNQAYKWLGPLMIFGCAVTYASYLVGSGQLIPRIGSVRFTSYVMLVSTSAVILHAWVAGHVHILHFPKEVYRISIGLSIIATLLPSFMISEAIRRLGASKVAIISSIGPISTIILASIFLGERLNAFQWLGAVIVISGVMLVNIEKGMNTREKKDQRKLAA